MLRVLIQGQLTFYFSALLQEERRGRPPQAAAGPGGRRHRREAPPQPGTGQQGVCVCCRMCVCVCADLNRVLAGSAEVSCAAGNPSHS